MSTHETDAGDSAAGIPDKVSRPGENTRKKRTRRSPAKQYELAPGWHYRETEQRKDEAALIIERLADANDYIPSQAGEHPAGPPQLHGPDGDPWKILVDFATCYRYPDGQRLGYYVAAYGEKAIRRVLRGHLKTAWRELLRKHHCPEPNPAVMKQSRLRKSEMNPAELTAAKGIRTLGQRFGLNEIFRQFDLKFDRLHGRSGSADFQRAGERPAQ